MSKVVVTFKDGSKRTYENGISVKGVAEEIDRKLAKEILAGKVDGILVDSSFPLVRDVSLEFITYNSQEGKEIYLHSASHIMAQAVKELFPEVKLGIGPAIIDGFYYDFEKETPFTPEDLERIEGKMKEIIVQDIPFHRRELPREEAIKYFAERDEKYKLELLEELTDSQVSFYAQGSFVDLCRGPHVPSTGRIKTFKLLSVAGAYWKGKESNPMLQRIYGTAFDTQAELEEYLYKLEEAKRRDHRRLGKELDLFSIQEELGPGLVLWHPKGALVRKIIEDFWREEHYKRGYQLVFSPHLAKIALWQTSGHMEFYQENMYSPIEVEGQKYIVKPMNCPGHILIYQTKTRSYRDLPLRYAELGTVYRYERTGVLHGLLRVRGFTQDDAHIFCRSDQLEDELIGVVDLARFMMKVFGFSHYEVYLSTRPERYVGTLENWEKATKALIGALSKLSLNYEIDPGEGVFYGPKIDIKLKDILGRAWQGPTIQVDFNLPERFNLTYIGENGREHRPVMVHRTILGSLERFMGALLEHYAGAFPLWLAPIQVRILTITDRQNGYASKLKERLEGEGIRAEADLRNEKIGFKVREAELQKIPYMLVIGDKEVASQTVAVRKRSGEDLGSIKVERFIEAIKGEIRDRL